MTGDTEHAHQVALFKYAHFQKDPAWKMLYATPNGGHRHKLVAVKLKQEGVKAGIPDLILPVMRKGFGGLYIELKRPKTPGKAKGRVTKQQAEWMEALTNEGYLCVVCWGWLAAKDTIEGYLDEV